jgi:hypothetical protein
MAILNNSNAISTTGGYDINNSLRFRASATAYLSRTFASSGTNNKIQTFSAWVKRGLLSSSTDYRLMGGYDGSSANSTEINFNNDSLRLEFGGAANNPVITTQVFRDPSAWYHIVVAIDTTQATAANRVKMYVNGNQVTAFSTATYPAQNALSQLTSANVNNRIGSSWSGSNPFDGYMTDINFIDGQALTPSSFGETDTTTGSWKPKAYTGTYGTNGFYLKFSDIATTSGSNAGLGKDFSGNANYWTTNNISVTAGTTYDAMIDSPTLTSATVANYPVLSPLNYRTFSGSVVPTISNANLTVTQASTTASCIGTATMGATASGKYYWEATFVSGNGSNNSFLGVVAGQLQNTTANDLGFYSTEYAYKSGNGNKYSNNTFTAYGSSYTSGDVIGFALDLDAGTLTFYKNNTSQGVAFSSLSASETYFPAFDTYYNNTFAYNFGQRPFAYTPPTGFVRLNTFNLPDSTIKKGSSYMDATLYTGTGAARTVTNTSGLGPEFVWVKKRSAAEQHALYDIVRGAGKRLESSTTIAEDTESNGMSSFNSDGFSIAGANDRVNTNGATYVAWQWDAGSSTVTNTSGTISSQVRANTTAGFSVVTYTGNGSSSATVGHGLGVAPSWVIIKNRGAVSNWVVRHSSLSSTQNVSLNTTDAAYTVSSGTANGGVGAVTSTTFGFISGTVGLISSNASAATYVAYCWAEIAGFSKFTSYTGNGSTDGTLLVRSLID